MFLTNKSGDVFGEYNRGGSFDIAVFHPRSKGVHRPQWMVYENREVVEFSFKEATIECPCLVFAYKKGERIGAAVPYDIQETSDKRVNLVLDRSDFDLVIWNEQGKALKSSIKNQ